jgi:hypothetical protein
MEAISAQCGVRSAPNAHDGGASDTLTDRGPQVKVLQEHDLVAVSSAGLQQGAANAIPSGHGRACSGQPSLPENPRLAATFSFAHTSTSKFDRLFQAMQPGRYAMEGDARKGDAGGRRDLGNRSSGRSAKGKDCQSVGVDWIRSLTAPCPCTGKGKARGDECQENSQRLARSVASPGWPFLVGQ